MACSVVKCAFASAQPRTFSETCGVVRICSMFLFKRLATPLGHNAAVKLASELVGRVASFVLALWAARQLGEDGFGLYNYGLALGFVLAQVADMGLQVLMTREVAVAGMGARPAVQAALRLKLLLSLPVVGLLVVLASGRPLIVQVSFFCLGLAMVLQTFLEFVAYVFRGQQRLREEGQLLAAARLLAAGAGGLVLWLGGGLLGLALANLAAIGLLAAWGLYRLRQEGWLGRTAEVMVTGWVGWPLLRQALPLGVATFLSIAYTRLAIFVLEARLGEAAVAHFSAAQRLVEPTQILPAALLAAVFPAVAQAMGQEPERARQLGRNSTALLALAGGGLAVFFWLAAPYLIPLLYGPEFGEATAVLRWLGLSILPAYINFGLTHWLIARGQQLYLSVLTGLMLVLHGVITWRFSLQGGAPAAAISVIIAESLLLAGCLLVLRVARPAQLLAQRLPGDVERQAITNL
jgi:O-antigen/teichoic acid export membrane protein